MASIRKTQFINGYIYHVYNRGVERRDIYKTFRDYERFIRLIDYYRYQKIPLSFSHFHTLPLEQRMEMSRRLVGGTNSVEIFAYCLMPNHFHLLIKQVTENGISRFISNISNSYAKYINTKNKRVGPLFQGAFKAVLVETDEQLIHLSRYIHINPVVSAIVNQNELVSYRWSSLSCYLEKRSQFVNSSLVLSHFKTLQAYRSFVFDQILYARKLEKVKHLALEEYV